MIHSSSSSEVLKGRSSGSRPRAAFLRYGSFSHINDFVWQQLTHQFPDIEFDVIDIAHLAFRRRLGLVSEAGRLLFEHGPVRLLRRRDPLDSLLQSTAIHRRLQREINATVRAQRCVFTLQTQSLWNGATPGIPHFIYTDHTELANLTYPAFDPKKLMPRWWLDLETAMYRDAARVFTMSSHVTTSLLNDYHCSPNAVECVYAGSNSPAHGNLCSPRLSTDPVILFVGVDWARKGGEDLVRAFVDVRRRHQGARLKIVGCKPDIRVPGCTVLGRVPLARMPELYAEATLFCLPTRLEPFGIAFVEAMHAGLPLIGSDIGAVRDLIIEGVNGCRVRSGQPAELAAAINRILSNPDSCRAMGEASRRIAQERYTWEAVGARFAKSIRQFLSTAAGTSAAPARISLAQ